MVPTVVLTTYFVDIRFKVIVEAKTMCSQQ